MVNSQSCYFVLHSYCALIFWQNFFKEESFLLQFYTLYTSYIYDVKAHVCCNYCKMLILRRLDFAELVLFHYSSNLLEILQYWLYCHYKSSLLNKNISWGINFKGKNFWWNLLRILGWDDCFHSFLS